MVVFSANLAAWHSMPNYSGAGGGVLGGNWRLSGIGLCLYPWLIFITYILLQNESMVNRLRCNAMPENRATKSTKGQGGEIFHDLYDVSLLRLRIEPSELRSVWMSWGSIELRALTSTKSTIQFVKINSIID